jgi:hypothetical protein
MLLHAEHSSPLRVLVESLETGSGTGIAVVAVFAGLIGRNGFIAVAHFGLAAFKVRVVAVFAARLWIRTAVVFSR